MPSVSKPPWGLRSRSRRSPAYDKEQQPGSRQLLAAIAIELQQWRAAIHAAWSASASICRRWPESLAVHVRRASRCSDRMLSWLFVHPRTLQAAALALVAGYLLWLWLGPHAPLAAAQHQTAPPLPSTPAASPAVHHAVIPAAPRATEPLDVVTAYIAASIVAGHTGDETGLYAVLTPDGPARAAVEHEFARRSRRLERHTPELVRWGLINEVVGPTTATIETQEVWHDQTLLGGTLISTDRNLIARYRYHLVRHRSDHPWRIDRVDTIPVVR